MAWSMTLPWVRMRSASSGSVISQILDYEADKSIEGANSTEQP